MRDIATATLSGNLTRDVRTQIAALGHRRRPAAGRRHHPAALGEEWVDKTNYLTVEVYGAQARSCAQYLRKGSRVLVDAELDWREWTDQHGDTREAVTLRARQVVFEGGRPGSAPVRTLASRTALRRGAGQAGPEPVGVTSAETDTSASAEDLPF